MENYNIIINQACKYSKEHLIKLMMLNICSFKSFSSLKESLLIIEFIFLDNELSDEVQLGLNLLFSSLFSCDHQELTDSS